MGRRQTRARHREAPAKLRILQRLQACPLHTDENDGLWVRPTERKSTLLLRETPESISGGHSAGSNTAKVGVDATWRCALVSRRRGPDAAYVTLRFE